MHLLVFISVCQYLFVLHTHTQPPGMTRHIDGAALLHPFLASPAHAHWGINLDLFMGQVVRAIQPKPGGLMWTTENKNNARHKPCSRMCSEQRGYERGSILSDTILSRTSSPDSRPVQLIYQPDHKHLIRLLNARALIEITRNPVFFSCNDQTGRPWIPDKILRYPPIAHAHIK